MKNTTYSDWLRSCAISNGTRAVMNSSVPPISDPDVAALVTQVAASTSAEQSAITLLNSLTALLGSAIAGATSLSASDRAALQAAVNQVANNTAALAAAVVTNTPAPVSPAGTAALNAAVAKS